MILDEYIEESHLLDQSELEKTRLFAYYHLRKNDLFEFSLSDVLTWYDTENLSKPNRSRLEDKIKKSPQFVNGSTKGSYKLHGKHSLKPLDEEYLVHLAIPASLQLKNQKGVYIDPTRISELNDINSSDLDLKKLVVLCEELNAAYTNGSKHSMAFLVRAIIDHVPPIFGCKNFGEVTNNYAGGGSFKQSMKNLDNSSRKIADKHLHTQVKKKEALPTLKQVDFSPDLDVLLAEILQKLG